MVGSLDSCPVNQSAEQLEVHSVQMNFLRVHLEFTWEFLERRRRAQRVSVDI